MTMIVAVSMALSVIGLAYLGAPLWAWTLMGLLSWAIAHADLSSTCLSLWIYGSLLAAILLVLWWPLLRRRFLIKPLFHYLQGVMPPMSATEREAIKAGDVWIDADLFQGRIQWDALLALPKPTLREDELAFLKGPVETLCGLFEEWDVMQHTFNLPDIVWDYLKKERFFGMIIPKTYGGLGFTALGHSTVVEKIASHSLTAAITAMVPNSLGPAELLLKYGTVAQKDYYLPRLACGQEIPCFGLTSAEAGSDAGAMIDQGIVCEGMFEGKTILGIRLQWDKRYITLAPIATVLGLAFKLYDPEQRLGKNKNVGITLCLIPCDHPGVERGQRHVPLHQAFMNGPICGKDVFIPLDWIIGGPEMIGQGWRMLIECLSVGRGISLPALSAASAKTAYCSTGAYARIRKQFNTSIGRFEGVESSMAQIAGQTYMIEAMRLLALTALDQDIHPAIVTAMSKYQITEMSRVAVNKAMDVHGGRGIMLGPHNYLGYCYGSVPISITVEGANILTRNLMIFGQGAIRCHPYIQQSIEAINHVDPTVGLLQFEGVFLKHFRYSLSNMARNIVHAFSAGWFCSTPSILSKKFFRVRMKGVDSRDGQSMNTGMDVAECHSEKPDYYRQLDRMSIALAWVADFSLALLGGRLKRLEKLSARLGDVLSYLYIGCALLKYSHDRGDHPEARAHLDWCMQLCLYRIQSAFLGLFDNFPIPGIGGFLKALVFPYGRPYAYPLDQLEHPLVVAMMTPSAFRAHWMEHYFLGDPQKNPKAQLEETLQQMIRVEPLLLTLDKAVKADKITKKTTMAERVAAALAQKIIDQAEATLLLSFEQQRLEAIRVDAFDPAIFDRKYHD